MGTPLEGVPALVFNTYLYADHARLAVTRRYYLPDRGADRRLSSVRLDLGLDDLSGLTTEAVLVRVAAAILRSLEPPEPPEVGA